jgi:uncharacterized membrane protein
VWLASLIYEDRNYFGYFMFGGVASLVITVVAALFTTRVLSDKRPQYLTAGVFIAAYCLTQVVGIRMHYEDASEGPRLSALMRVNQACERDATLIGCPEALAQWKAWVALNDARTHQTNQKIINRLASE